MKMVLRIKKTAKEHALTLSGIARKLGIHRSNMSAIASGARGVSLKTLEKIADILDCSIDELIGQKTSPVFKDRRVESVLRDIENAGYDGMDKTWVDALMFAQRTHYRAVKGGSLDGKEKNIRPLCGIARKT